jgi:hypothetical protein
LAGEGSASDKNVTAFTSSQVRIVRAWPKPDSSDFTLSMVMERAKQLREKAGQPNKKASIFLDSVQRAASEFYGEDARYMEPLKGQDWGGFSDIGQHAHCTPPTTSWALVVAALRHVLTSTARFLPT